MLCSTCQTKTPSHFLGHCTKTPCNKVTTSCNFKLCDDCSKQLQECSWCRGPLSGSASNPTVSSGVRFVTSRDNDNGGTFKGLQIGQAVHIQLTEDTWSGKEWGVRSYSRGNISQYGTPTFTQDPNNQQYGTREFVFDLHSLGTFDIELHEVTRTHSWWGGGGGGQPVQNGKTYKVTVVVK